MDSVPTKTLQQLSPCDVAALEKCLKEHKGDRGKCLEEINTFQRACGQVKPQAAAASSSQPQQQAAAQK